MKDLIKLDCYDAFACIEEKISQACDFISGITVSRKHNTTLEINSKNSSQPLFKKSYNDEKEIPAVKLVGFILVGLVVLKLIYCIAVRMDRYKWLKKNKKKIKEQQKSVQ